MAQQQETPIRRAPLRSNGTCLCALAWDVSVATAIHRVAVEQGVVVQVLDQKCFIDLRQDADKQTLARHLGCRPVGDHVASATVVGWSANEHVLRGRMLLDTPMRSVLFKRP